jgi:hypothetical protein
MTNAQKTAEAIIKIMRGEVRPQPLPRVRELTDAEAALAKIMKEIRK